MRHAPSVKQPTQSGRSLPSPERTSQELATPIDGSVRTHPASDRGSEFVAGRGSVDTLPDSRRSDGRATPGTPCLRHRTSTPGGDPTSSRPSVCQSDPGPAPSLFVPDGIRGRCREGGSRGCSSGVLTLQLAAVRVQDVVMSRSLVVAATGLLLTLPACGADAAPTGPTPRRPCRRPRLSPPSHRPRSPCRFHHCPTRAW
jgi:hypothetical protein